MKDFNPSYPSRAGRITDNGPDSLECGLNGCQERYEMDGPGIPLEYFKMLAKEITLLYKEREKLKAILEGNVKRA